MENPTPYTPPGFGMGQRDLPNSKLVLILGIISIVTSCCQPIGLVLAILALVFNSKDQKLYQSAPDQYTSSSYSNLNIGKVCAIIALVLSALSIIWLIVSLTINGGMFMQQYREMLEQNQNDESLLIIQQIPKVLTFIC